METLVNMPSATSEQVKHLCHLINIVDESINTFTALERKCENWDDIYVYFVETKLAESTRLDWIKHKESKKLAGGFAKYADLKGFLEERICSLDVVQSRIEKSTRNENFEYSNASQAPYKERNASSAKRNSKNTGVHVAMQKPTVTYPSSTCSYCKGEHFIGYCPKFAACPTAQRRTHAASAKLCFNCLNSNHSADVCRSKGRCFVCSNKHHTKLHSDAPSATNALARTSESNSTEAFNALANTQQTVTLAATVTTKVLLSTACVVLQAPNGQSLTVRALLDSGAEESFVSEYVAQALSLQKRPASVVVSGVGCSTTAVARNRISVYLKSNQNSDFCFTVSALVLKKLTTFIPRSEIPMQDWSHLSGLQLADPHFNVPSRIDCVLNSEAYAAALLPGIKQGAPGMPVALKSIFGWVLMGAANSELTTEPENTLVHHVTVDSDLSAVLARFWESEEPPGEEILSPAEQVCANHFRSTHSRNEEGRFVVRLPFVKAPSSLNTHGLAEACFHRLERRFAKHPDLHKSYCAFMQEYADLEHMEVVPSHEVSVSNTSYLPHHPVTKKDSDKIRVVFNASQKSSTGISLNSMLHTGPKLQEDVIIIITRWSFLPFAFTCDVVKMFRQFLVHIEDADWQRILWRRSTDSPIEIYRLLTVTYGTACAPFIANACMLQLAEDEQTTFPEGAKVLQEGRYVDDLFAGGDSLEEALLVRNQLIGILHSAGMKVGKWAVNNSALLTNVNVNNSTDEGTMIQEQDVVSTLGLKWLSSEDAFCFKVVQSDLSDKITKRTILSEIARLYDPIGWLAPVIVSAKIILQNLWLQGVDWDEPVSKALTQTWLTFRQQLSELEAIRIPRWCGSSKNSIWYLHCFCDASERAYAAAIYAVVHQENGLLSSKLIAAKSKVAPIKVVSLPRLELCGAFLLSRLVKYLLTNLKKEPAKVFCWSDSKVVLAWLQAHPSRWKSFIANRVSEIVSSLPTAIWGHVRSADNPADLPTRGITPAQLREATLWWQGPVWLQRPVSEWPSSSENFQTEEEARSAKNAFISTVNDIAEFTKWLENFSSVDKIIRILAHVHRWRENAKKIPSDRQRLWLTAAEISAGRIFLIRLVQREEFGAELKALERRETLGSSSALCRLSPILDQHGLLRVGGRLQNAFLTEDEKHPIILPGKNIVTRLIIRKAHKVTLHGGPTIVQSHLSRQFWIVRGRNVIRGVVRACVQCARHRATTLEQQMGSLPAVRTRPARPFSYTGVDFAGPFSIKCSAGRGQKSFKGYVAIFVCLVIRAVHLEVVSDLTSVAFLAAFRRFVARRGLCKVIYSDNGTSFQGADSELQRLFGETSAMRQEVAAALAGDQVEWKYIPPRAPNFGGLWEANVKSFKFHLKRVVNETKLTFEEFYTVTSSIEACLNSRPLSAMSSSEEDNAALTPGHFLIGAPLTAAPEPFDETNESPTVSSRWHLLTLMKNHFWKRWQREFLLQAQQRSKWLYPNRSFKVGDLVLFKDQLMPPTKWPLARIVRLYQGPDGLSRVADIKTSTGEYKRPVNKLILLPTSEEASTHLTQLRALMTGENCEACTVTSSAATQKKSEEE